MVNNQILQYARDLNRTYHDLKTKHEKLRKSYLDTIKCLVLAAKFKDEETGVHIMRIGQMCALIARKMGMDSRIIENIRIAAPLHDIGKIGIPDTILLKKGKLTRVEFEVMKTHTIIGAKILSNSRSKVLIMGQQIAISHHEKWNGKGYPYGLAGEGIPLFGRIVALADFFDALTSKRPYRDPFPKDNGIDMIREERGQHFDPKIVDIFLDNLNEVTFTKSLTCF
jgi:putative two-component system response regulator